MLVDRQTTSSGSQSNGGFAAVGQRESLLGRQLIVRNIPENVGWKELKDLMRQAGNVVRVNIMMGSSAQHRDLQQQQSLTHAVVLFSNSRDAQYAIDLFHGYKWHDRALNVVLDRSLSGVLKAPPSFGAGIDGGKGSGTKSSADLTGGQHDDMNSADQDGSRKTQIFVCNLPYIVGWQDLKDLFREAGPVIRTDIRCDPKSGKSKGLGTVLFTNPKSAKVAVETFNGFEWFGRKIDVREDKSFVDKSESTVGTMQRFNRPAQSSGHSQSTNPVSARVGNHEDPSSIASRLDDVHLTRTSWAEKVKSSSSTVTNEPSSFPDDTREEELKKSSPDYSPVSSDVTSPYNPKSKPTSIPSYSQPAKGNDILGPSLMFDESVASLSAYGYRSGNPALTGGTSLLDRFGKQSPSTTGGSSDPTRNIWNSTSTGTNSVRQVLSTSPLTGAISSATWGTATSTLPSLAHLSGEVTVGPSVDSWARVSPYEKSGRTQPQLPPPGYDGPFQNRRYSNTSNPTSARSPFL